MTFRRHRYPANWRTIVAGILQRAGELCECTGQCGAPHDGGRCNAPQHAMIVREETRRWRWTEHHCNGVCMGESCPAKRVVLTVAHVDHDEQHNAPENLLALCQRCHLVMDGADNLHRRRERRAAEDGQRPLPLLAVMPEHRKTGDSR